MFSLEWFRIGRAARGMPRRAGVSHGRRAAIGLLACITLIQTGCQSGPFGDCKLFSPCGFFGRTTGAVFNRNRATTGGCCGGSGIVSDGPVEYGAPSGVIVPGPSAPTYVAPGSTSSSVPDSSINELEPLPGATPKAKLGPPSSSMNGGGSSTTPTRSSFNTPRMPGSAITAKQGDSVSRTVSSSPEPASRSAQAPITSTATAGWDDRDPLDNLPPLDLPGEVTRSAATPPTPPTIDRKNARVDRVSDATPPRRDANALETGLDSDRATSETAEPAPAVSIGPGIARFVSVDLKLAGGSAPSTAGLNWLAQKGYRTLLDMRDSSEVPSGFIAEVTKRGLRYVALPVSAGKLDRDEISRFHFEMNLSEARPLYFFDTDGSRAGGLWYVRRMTIDHADPVVARREAEEIGLTAGLYMQLVANYVAAESASKPPATAAAAAPAKPPETAPTSKPNNESERKPLPLKSASADDASPAWAMPIENVSVVRSSEEQDLATFQAMLKQLPAVKATPVADATKPTEPPLKPGLLGDTGAWRAIAAAVVTTLSLPLAYLSRSMAPVIVARTWASLPAMGPRPKALPGESGARI
jgi:protein tyrosine phosphatase (PTP) superfamily phosphohydrolase (DUF442 family)